MSRKEPQPKLQIYKDWKFILVKYDKLNYAILNATRFRQTKREDQALLDYSPTLQAGLEKIIRLRAEYELLEKVRELGPFKSLDTLVSEYTKSILTATYQVLSQVKQHKSRLAEVKKL